MNAAIDMVLNELSRDRLWVDHERLSVFGRTAKGGVNRQALSEEECLAREELIGWAREYGLAVFSDELSNVFVQLEGKYPALPPVLLGSHIDSQPTGGKFDGAYGVLAGLEVLRAVRSAGCVPFRSIEVVSWMNEEGSRFAPGMMGSAGFAGVRKMSDIVNVSDSNGISVSDELARMHQRFGDIPTRPLGFALHAYVEPHIEQGPVLEREAKTIGVVTGIQGKRTYTIDVIGEEAHAGTTPRAARKDALLAAVRMVLALEQATSDGEDITRFTVGRFSVSPNAPSVVPAKVSFSIDVRHPDGRTLELLDDRILRACEAERAPCEVHCRELVNDHPVEFSADIRRQVEQTARRLGIPHMPILSGAGHDAKFLAALCPTGMIFVPCKNGISHSEMESATPADLFAGAMVLCDVACRLAEIER